MRGIRSYRKPKQVLRTVVLKSLSVFLGLYIQKGQGLEKAHHLKEQGIENISNLFWKVWYMFYTLFPSEGAIFFITYRGEVFHLPFQAEGDRCLGMKLIFSILPLPHLSPFCHLLETSQSLQLLWCPMNRSFFSHVPHAHIFFCPILLFNRSLWYRERGKARDLRSEVLSLGGLTKNGLQASEFFNVLQACWYAARVEN